MSANGKVLRKFEIGFLLAFCVLLCGAIGVAISAVQISKTLSDLGSLKIIGANIYWDSACTNQTSSINWGLLNPGSSETLQLYVENTGNAPVTLSMTVQDWNPSTAQSYMSLNWNYASQTLSPGQVLPVGLTLTVSSTVSGISNFSFDTTITATSS
jgi:hypothetical protein